MTNRIYQVLIAVAALSVAAAARAGSISDAKAATSGDVAIEGVVVGRGVLSDTEGFFFVQDGEDGIGVKFSGPTDGIPATLTSVKVNATATDSAYLLASNPSAIETVSTNAAPPKPIVAQDLSNVSADGQYTIIPGSSIDKSEPNFKGGETIEMTASGGSIDLFVSQSIDGKAKPTYDFHMFGVVANDGIIGGDGSKKIAIPARFVPTFANTVRTEVATKRTCVTCHAVKAGDTKLVGPNYAWVAEKYKDDPNAVESMIEQMNNGGMGKWGPVPMIPFKGIVPPDEMQQLAEWIWSMRWPFLLNE